MRIPHRGLPLAAYPFHTGLQVRLSDLDFARHVNNAAVAALHEEVRVRFHLQYFGPQYVFERQEGGGGAIAYIAMHYLREIFHNQSLIGCAGIAHLGKTSYTMAHALFQNDQCVGEAECVIAMRDNGAAAALDRTARDLLQRLLIPARETPHE